MAGIGDQLGLSAVNALSNVLLPPCNRHKPGCAKHTAHCRNKRAMSTGQITHGTSSRGLLDLVTSVMRSLSPTPTASSKRSLSPAPPACKRARLATYNTTTTTNKLHAGIRNKKPITRFTLLKTGASSAEYMSVLDQVLKYIRPEHNWRPKITRIEKVRNEKLEKIWKTAKAKMFYPDFSALKFHGTNASAVEAIIKDGFKLPTRAGMYGKGIYFATDSSKSANTLYTQGSGMLLLCEVLLGNVKQVRSSDSTITDAQLKREHFDSIFAPRNSRSTGGVVNDEFVIYDPDKALPRYIIHYI